MQTPSVGNYRPIPDRLFARSAAESAHPGLWQGLIFAHPGQIANPTTAYDVSRNHKNGAISDASVSPEKALVFDSSVSYITLPADSSFDLASYSFACRIKTTDGSYPGWTPRLILYKGNSSNREPVSIYVNTNKFIIEYYNAGPNYFCGYGGWAINDGLWHTVCFVRNAGVSVSIYVDGDRYDSASDGGNTVTVANQLYVGQRGNGSYRFNGSMRDLFLWNRHLPSEIARQVSAGSFPTARVKRGAVGQAGATAFFPRAVRNQNVRLFNGPTVY